MVLALKINVLGTAFMSAFYSVHGYFASVITDVFDAISDIVTAVIALFVNIFSDSGIIAIFYDTATGLTFVGTLLLIAFGFGLVRWAFGWVKNLLRMRKG